MSHVNKTYIMLLLVRSALDGQTMAEGHGALNLQAVLRGYGMMGLHIDITDIWILVTRNH
jgi:hypothetical protein